MSITITGEHLCFIIPAIAVFLWSRNFSSVKTGGGYFPATSERDTFWFFGAPIYVIVSLLCWAIYLKVQS